MISLLLLPVSCKQQEPAKKQPATDNANPITPAPLDRPETTPEEEHEDCEKDGKKDEHDDEEDDEVDEDDELELRLTGSVKTTKKKKSTKAPKEKKPAQTTVAGFLRGFGLLASEPNYDDDISSIFI